MSNASIVLRSPVGDYFWLDNLPLLFDTMYESVYFCKNRYWIAETGMEIKKFGFYFLLLIIVALAVKFYFIIEDLLPALATACVFAYLFNPIYVYLVKITKRKSLSAFIIIFIIFALIFIPFLLIVFGLQKEFSVLFTENTFTSLQDALTGLQIFFSDQFSLNISDYVDNFKSQMSTAMKSAITVIGPKILFSISGLALYAFLSIFIMYYLLIHSENVLDTIKDYFPLSCTNIDKLLGEIALNTRTLVLGQLLIAVIQGTLSGIGFLIFGISGALIWGFVTVIMSFIPFLGTFIVWFPAGIIQLAQHNYFSGIGIILWGFLLVGNIDNVVRPKLISSLGNIHPVTVLLGVFIGLKEWGFIGLVLGPMIISVLLTLIRMFREEYLEKRNQSE
jgi:predicted PurR-regulated permease PerM